METRKERQARIDQEDKVRKERRKKYVSMVRSVRSDITKSSYLSVKYKLDLIETTNCAVDSDLSRGEVIEAYKEAIEKYLEKQRP